MSSQSLRLVRRAAQSDARAERIARILSRYCQEVQPALRRLAARHPHLADLTVSFPALAVALACPRRGFEPDSVIALTVAGAPLAELAKAAVVPIWLRKLPPEAFARELPVVPEARKFACRVLNHLPARPVRSKTWLEAVALAAFWADEDFAIWIAREFTAAKQPVTTIDPGRIRRLALWSFFSRAPGTRAHMLIEKKWTPALSMKSAAQAAAVWIDAIDLYLNLGDVPLADMWLAPGNVGGFDFVPLATATDVLVEARAMGNCLRTYGGDLAHNASRLWSMRKDGRRVATLRIGRGRREPLPNLYELEFPRNVAASPEVWWAAHQWLRIHDLRRVEFTLIPWNSAPLDRGVWQSLWRPWWLAKKRIPASLPLTPTRSLLNSL